jgi:chromate transporter
MTGTPSLFMILRSFLGLGLTSFGGPVAHIGYFRILFVEQRKWISPDAFQSLFGLCQMLPGPSSSQLGFALGVRWGGLAGGCLAFIGFTLPSAIVMIGFGYGLMHIGADLSQLINALKLVTAAVVLHAVVGMARSFASGAVKSILALAMMSVVLIIDMPFLHPFFILISGLIGMLVLKHEHHEDHLHHDRVDPVADAYQSRLMPLVWLWGFAAIFAMLLFLAHLKPDSIWFALSQFYITGSLVFGGGHVVLPLLQASVVETELVTLADFLAGYGMAQVIPGPLFTFGGFLGAVMGEGMAAIWFGLIAMLTLFLPSFLLLLGVLPFWEIWMRSHRFKAALAGINAAVVGLLVAVLIDPVLVTAIHNYYDLAIVIAGFLVLLSGRINTGFVVLGLVAMGWFI